MEMKKMCQWFDENKAWGMIALRIALAILFIAKGYSKITGLQGTSTFFANVGIPAAGFFAVVVALVELVGGIMILIGLGTRPAALLLSITMIVAILAVHISAGVYELAMVSLGGTLAVLFNGPTKCTLDAKVMGKKHKK